MQGEDMLSGNKNKRTYDLDEFVKSTKSIKILQNFRIN